MQPILAALAAVQFLGIPLIIIGIILFVVSFVVVRRQKAVAAASGYDDYREDPDVQRLSNVGRLFLWGGVVIAIVGAAIFASTDWATIF